LPLDVDLQSVGHLQTEAEVEAGEQLGGVQGSVDGFIAVEVVLHSSEAHLFLRIDGKSAVEERDEGVAGRCWRRSAVAGA
jgi:hypothetical protein